MRAPWMFLAAAALIGCGAPPAEAPSAPMPPASEVTPSPAAPDAAPEMPSESPASAKSDAGKEEPAAAPAKQGPPPPLPEGTVVLHIGDSMADALGGALNAELEKHGVKGYLEAKEATYIPQWAGFKMQLSSHIARRKPDLVVVTLGGNETKMPDPTERVDAIKRLVKKIGDRPCIWIAAPLWEGLEHTGILDVIRENAAPCRYVDTNAMIPDLERYDGIHPTIPERTRWAQFMIRWLMHNRDPKGPKPWSLREKTSPPPPGSEKWLEGK
ncbi:MAG: SGNH/GDSL hydrolase family protein [Polyangiaceae bacterium]